MNIDEIEEFRRKYPKMARELVMMERFPINLYRKFERVFKRIEETWGTAIGAEYFEELLMTKRTERQGFASDVATELMRLHLLHIQRYSVHPDNSSDPYSENGISN